VADSRTPGRITEFAPVVAAALLLLGAGLGGIDLWAPDEPRYGQVAEELRSFEHGPRGLVLLHLGGEPYTQKPPLYFWLAALAGALSGGVSETAARLPSAAAGVATVALAFAFARRLFPGGIAPWLAGAILLTSFRFAHLARRAQLDILLTALETLALLAFWRIESEQRRTPRRSLLVLLHGALGAAALTKGPVAWLPFVIIAGFLLWERRLADLRRLVPPWSLALSLAPVVVWIGAATWLAPEGFFSEAVVANLFDRVVAASSHVRPFYYYLYQLPADFLPWTLLWPLAFVFVVRSVRAQGALPSSWRLLLLWVAVPLLLFSLSSSKRGLYLLPAFPALALMLAGAVDDCLRTRGTLPQWLRRGLLATALLILLGAVGVALAGGIESRTWPGFGVAAGSAWAIAAIAGLGAGAGVLMRGRRETITLQIAITAVFAIELLVFTVVYPAHDEQKSPRPIALLAADLSDPGETIGVFAEEGLAGGILYYGDRNVEFLPRAEQVVAFFEGGGRWLLLEEAKLPWLGNVGRFRVHATARRGARQLAFVSLEDDSQKSP
jgi:4-amino-4-deoxy-L-arabinose transferase-like glycosyltransferase